MKGWIERDTTLKTARYEIRLSEPFKVPQTTFVGRDRELELCGAAWDVSKDGTQLLDAPDGLPLNFRIVGPPGSGKNEVAYEMARRLRLPLYIMQGHEELTPEDLVLIVAPEPGSELDRNASLVLRASPLTTALITGGLFFFDEINRVPQRALSPLASVLDDRRALYSALAGIWLEALEDQERDRPGLRNRFRFCCAMNPRVGELPQYLEQRTLPAIEIDYPPPEDVQAIVKQRLNPNDLLLSAFHAWQEQEQHKLSIRQALIVMGYAMKLEAMRYSAGDAVEQAAKGVQGEADA